ncbi:MAG TPA: alpha/beta hydrolase [Alphaproteobacteria bacterium]|nr:alpha/beta hydrolase [Alphaproteobacteria bacterium]
MDEQEPQFLEVGAGDGARRIAYRLSRARRPGPQLIWFPGFLSDMASTKAAAIADWADAEGLAMMRFDYSAHGRSSGKLLDACIGDWLEQSLAVWDLMGNAPRIVIGSSMGGWIALLLARHLAKQGRSDELAGLVLIAPAFDMTETLMWRELPPEARAEIETKRVTYVPSDYDDPYPITKRLIEEGRSHLLTPFDPGCPVRILQGMRDPDVPWRHALALIDLLTGPDIELTLIKDAEHRQSRPEDLRRLTATIAALAGRAS